MKRIQAEIMWFLWRRIDWVVCFVLRNVYILQGKWWTDLPIWDWYLTHIATEAYYHEVKLNYVKDGLWPPPVAEGE